MTIQRKRVAKRLASGLLAGAMALGGLAISGASPVSAETPTTNRIAGVDRYDTSVALASATDATADHVIIVSGENYPDALAASGYAGRLNSGAGEESVILLTRAGELPASVVNYLSNSSNLSSDAKAYIVGGTSVVSEAVATQVTAITGLTPTRISGDNRYETAIALSVKGAGTSSVILVSGTGYADGVSASGWAFASDQSVLLSGPSGLDAATQAEVKRLTTANANLAVNIVGGTSAVPDQAISDLVDQGVKYANINRIAGADRYATATALNSALVAAGGSFNGSKVALITGENFADAIAAAPYLGSTSTHTALVSSSGVPAGTAALVAAVAPANPASVIAIGGYAAVANTTLAAVKQAASDAGVWTPTITVAENAAASGATATMKIVKLPAAVTNGETCAAAACAATDTVSKWLGTKSNYTINGVNLSSFGTGGVSAATSASGADATVTITLPDGFSSAGVVVGFAGLVEGASTVAGAGNGNTTFSIAAASATIADDATAPTLTVLAASANGADGTNASGVDGTAGYVVIAASETITGFAAADVSWKTAAGTAKCAADTVDATGAPVYKLECKVIDTGDSTSVDGQAIAATDVVTIALDGFADVAGNKGGATGATQVITIAAADTTKPTLSRGAVTVTATTASTFAVSLTTGTLTFTSAADSPMHGQGGNGWRAVLENISGNIPSVSVDATTKRITISANFAKHTGNDIINAIAQNSGGAKGLLTAAASSAGADGVNKLGAGYLSGDTVAPTVGNSTTSVVLNASEMLSGVTAAKITNATCGGTPISYALTTDSMGITVSCTAASTPVSGNFVLLADAVTDLMGNKSAADATGI